MGITFSILAAAGNIDLTAPCHLCHFCPAPLGICVFVWAAVILALLIVLVAVSGRGKKCPVCGEKCRRRAATCPRCQYDFISGSVPLIVAPDYDPLAPPPAPEIKREPVAVTAEAGEPATDIAAGTETETAAEFAAAPAVETAPPSAATIPAWAAAPRTEPAWPPPPRRIEQPEPKQAAVHKLWPAKAEAKSAAVANAQPAAMPEPAPAAQPAPLPEAKPQPIPAPPPVAAEPVPQAKPEWPPARAGYKRCPDCGRELPERAVFCAECGKRLS